MQRDHMVVTTGPVGAGGERTEASYVLVDAVSKANVDTMVTLRGHLVDEGGAKIGRLTQQSLRVPAGGRRTFALVDSDSEAHPDGAAAVIEVFGAVEMEEPPPVIVTEGHVYDDRGRAVVTGYVVNTTDREVTAAVIAGFYGQGEAPMKRPSTAFRLAPNAKRGVQFVGPDGSRSAYLFVGETVF